MIERETIHAPSASRYHAKISRFLATNSFARSTCPKPIAAATGGILYLNATSVF